MVDWAQIIAAVIGSSLVAFLLTNGLIDYNQPKIRITVDKIEIPDLPTQKRFDTTIINEGLSTASDLRVTLHYPSGNITNYRFLLKGEDATSSIDPQAQGTLVIRAPRLAPSGVLLVHTIVTDSEAPYFVKGSRDKIEYRCPEQPVEPPCPYKYKGSYFISATYNQSGTQVTTDYSQTAYRPLEKIVPYNLIVVLIIAFALIVLISIMLYREINKKGLPPINKWLVLIIGILDFVVITTILFYAVPSQLGLFGWGLWIPLLIFSVVGLLFVIISSLRRRQRGAIRWQGGT